MAKYKDIDVARLTAPEVKRTDEMEAFFQWSNAEDKAMGMPDLNLVSVAEMRAWRARGSVRTNANPPKVEDIERVLVPGETEWAKRKEAASRLEASLRLPGASPGGSWDQGSRGDVATPANCAVTLCVPPSFPSSAWERTCLPKLSFAASPA